MRTILLLSIILFLLFPCVATSQGVSDLYRLRDELQSNIDDLTEQLARINLKIKEIELQQAKEVQQSYETVAYSPQPERSATASIRSPSRDFGDNYSCSTLMKSEKDEFTGKVMTSIAEGIVVSDDETTGFGINLFSRDDNDLIFLTIKTVGAGNCVEERDRIYINFVDGSKMELVHMGGFDCDATATVYFGRGYGNRRKLKELSEKRIEAMRVWVGDKYVDKRFSGENSLALMNAVRCFY